MKSLSLNECSFGKGKGKKNPPPHSRTRTRTNRCADTSSPYIFCHLTSDCLNGVEQFTATVIYHTTPYLRSVPYLTRSRLDKYPGPPKTGQACSIATTKSTMLRKIRYRSFYPLLRPINGCIGSTLLCRFVGRPILFCFAVFVVHPERRDNKRSTKRWRGRGAPCLCPLRRQLEQVGRETGLPFRYAFLHGGPLFYEEKSIGCGNQSIIIPSILSANREKRKHTAKVLVCPLTRKQLVGKGSMAGISLIDPSIRGSMYTYDVFTCTVKCRSQQVDMVRI